ncbi:DUF4234 domain-containing protein [Acinetobacter gyllenbergii]|uniref:DUF4234 domain-containing protein n=1 Tax=Acinetobacter TaxID=469 RepID=UPI000806A26B|nr:DUF4234 domain-containing protein [Acinetobacter gyllenbergii]MCU4581236.1 DUF4234 domain-containing protein [Acinetobacter gyllenbergii]OBY76202.1 hypothetical protein NG55_05990 [Acinetobacter gyllenbergii]
MTNSDTDLIEAPPIKHHLADLKIISMKKFIVLSIISFGLYQIWWMFKAWRFFAIKDNLKIMPAVRAIFSIFFLYSLFNKIQSYAQENGYTRSFSAAWMFVGYLLITFACNLPDPYWLISLFNFIFMIPAFVAFNYAKTQSDEVNSLIQEKFSTAHVVVIIIGSLLWLLVLAGLLMGSA